MKELKPISIDYYGLVQKIKETGDNGILQSDLWKMLGATSREGSRVAMKLVKSGLVRRERKLHMGKWTYQLISNKHPIKSESMMDNPCSFCIDQIKCGEPRYIAPENCERLTGYIFELAQENPKLKKLS